MTKSEEVVDLQTALRVSGSTEGSTEVRCQKRGCLPRFKSTSQSPVPRLAIDGSGSRRQPPLLAQVPARGQKRKRLEDEKHILGSVKREETREDTLVQRLTEHVERIDTDMVRGQCQTASGQYALGLQYAQSLMEQGEMIESCVCPLAS